jgi:type II secretory pathway pseudopilin PulG
MTFNLLKSSPGFTYIAVLVLVVVMGIMLGAASQSWTMIMKRDREKELLFRGAQIRDAIESYRIKSGTGRQPMPLKDLKDLLKDPRSTSNIRYLRKLYTDPLTNKEWKVISDPQKGIVGVASTSEEEPLKKDFTDYPKDSPEFAMFGGKLKYSEWAFVPLAYQSLVANLTVKPGQPSSSGQTPSSNQVPVPGQSQVPGQIP